MAEQEHIHELVAGYALDALDDGEQRTFEEHLKACSVCARELERLRAAAASLALAVDETAPPPALRGRLLERVRAERQPPSSSPERSRFVRPALAVAAAALAAAIGLGVWAATLSDSLDRERAARRDDARAAAILASPDASLRRLGRRGQVAVLPSGQAALVAALPPAPEGKTYEVWVIEGDRPLAAGLFRGGRDTLVVLERPVPKGARVAVTMEPQGGSTLPTGPILAGSGAI